MNIIVDHKRTRVIFDPKRNTYIKTFFPKPSFRLKYFLRLRRYPGKNFKHIARTLEGIGVNVPKIIESSNYSVTTERVEGELLRDYIKRDRTIVKPYLDLIVKILKNNIYFGDFNTGNFIVNDGKIYALDLEDYRKELFFSKGQEEALRRLRITLDNEEWAAYVEKRLKNKNTAKEVAQDRAMLV